MPWSTRDDIPFDAHLDAQFRAIEAALAVLGYDALAVHAGDLHPLFLDDQHYPFRANPWFQWLVPEVAAGSVLWLRPGHRPRLWFVAADDYWHAPPTIPTDPWTARFEISPVVDAAAARAQAGAQPGRVAWLGEAQPPGEGWEANPPRLLAHLEQARCHKSAYEIACLREATRIGVAGHRAAETAFRAGASEFDIHLAYLAATRHTDADLPYPSIVALNAHAATLHYQLRDRHAPRHLSMLIDAGASCRGYGCDITRTWAMAPGLFATLVEGMHDLQQSLCEAVAPGVSWPALHLHAHHLLAQLLRDAGALRMDAAEAVATGVSAAFLPHGLGHLLGLQVHDVGGFRAAPDAPPLPRPPGHPALRLTRPLEAGMVVTVEPGLYFIDSLLAALQEGPHASAVNWPLVNNLRAWGGIRIEDNVLVTPGGRDNLTRTAFADAV